MNTTKEQFDLFQSEFLKWQDKFDMKHIKVRFYHYNIAKYRYAEINLNDFADCVAGVTFNKENDSDSMLTDNEIQCIAKHEAIHLFMNQLTYLARQRFASCDEITRTDEAMTVLLTQLLK